MRLLNAFQVDCLLDGMLPQCFQCNLTPAKLSGLDNVNAQWRCRCPLEVADAVRRTVAELVSCVDREADAMTVVRRRRSIVGSLGTAQDLRWERVLPLMRAVTALVRTDLKARAHPGAFVDYCFVQRLAPCSRLEAAHCEPLYVAWLAQA